MNLNVTRFGRNANAQRTRQMEALHMHGERCRRAEDWSTVDLRYANCETTYESMSAVSQSWPWQEQCTSKLFNLGRRMQSTSMDLLNR